MATIEINGGAQSSGGGGGTTTVTAGPGVTVSKSGDNYTTGFNYYYNNVWLVSQRSSLSEGNTNPAMAGESQATGGIGVGGYVAGASAHAIHGLANGADGIGLFGQSYLGLGLYAQRYDNLGMSATPLEVGRLARYSSSAGITPAFLGLSLSNSALSEVHSNFLLWKWLTNTAGSESGILEIWQKFDGSDIRSLSVVADGNADVISLNLIGNAYLNWGSVWGQYGYGLRDTYGRMQFKHLDGEWKDFCNCSGSTTIPSTPSLFAQWVSPGVIDVNIDSDGNADRYVVEFSTDETFVNAPAYLAESSVANSVSQPVSSVFLYEYFPVVDCVPELYETSMLTNSILYDAPTPRMITGGGTTYVDTPVTTNIVPGNIIYFPSNGYWGFVTSVTSSRVTCADGFTNAWTPTASSEFFVARSKWFSGFWTGTDYGSSSRPAYQPCQTGLPGMEVIGQRMALTNNNSAGAVTYVDKLKSYNTKTITEVEFTNPFNAGHGGVVMRSLGTHDGSSIYYYLFVMDLSGAPLTGHACWIEKQHLDATYSKAQEVHGFTSIYAERMSLGDGGTKYCLTTGELAWGATSLPVSDMSLFTASLSVTGTGVPVYTATSVTSNWDISKVTAGDIVSCNSDAVRGVVKAVSGSTITVHEWFGGAPSGIPTVYRNRYVHLCDNNGRYEVCKISANTGVGGSYTNTGAGNITVVRQQKNTTSPLSFATGTTVSQYWMPDLNKKYSIVCDCSDGVSGTHFRMVVNGVVRRQTIDFWLPGPITSTSTTFTATSCTDSAWNLAGVRPGFVAKCGTSIGHILGVSSKTIYVPYWEGGGTPSDGASVTIYNPRYDWFGGVGLGAYNIVPDASKFGVADCYFSFLTVYHTDDTSASMSIRVKAANEIGQSGWSDTFTLESGSIPTPTLTTIEDAVDSHFISWENPFSNSLLGFEILGYDVLTGGDVLIDQYVANGSSTFMIPYEATHTSLHWSIRAYNPYGFGAESSPRVTTTPIVSAAVGGLWTDGGTTAYLTDLNDRVAVGTEEADGECLGHAYTAPPKVQVTAGADECGVVGFVSHDSYASVGVLGLVPLEIGGGPTACGGLNWSGGFAGGFRSSLLSAGIADTLLVGADRMNANGVYQSPTLFDGFDLSLWMQFAGDAAPVKQGYLRSEVLNTNAAATRSSATILGAMNYGTLRNVAWFQHWPIEPGVGEKASGMMILSAQTGAVANTISSANDSYATIGMDLSATYLNVIGGGGNAYLRLGNDDGYGVSLIAPSSMSSNVSITLPNSAGTAGQALLTDGTGKTAWGTVSGGGGGDSLFTSYSGSTYLGTGGVASSDNLVVGATTGSGKITAVKSSGISMFAMNTGTTVGDAAVFGLVTDSNAVGLMGVNTDGGYGGGFMSVGLKGTGIIIAGGVRRDAIDGVCQDGDGVGFDFDIEGGNPGDETDNAVAPATASRLTSEWVDATGYVGKFTIWNNYLGTLYRTLECDNVASGGGFLSRMHLIGSTGAVNQIISRDSASATSPLSVLTNDLRLEYADGVTTLKFYEDPDNGTNYIGLQAPSAITASKTFILPGTDGSSGQALITDGSGTLSWGDAGGAGWVAGTGYVELETLTDHVNIGGGATASELRFYELSGNGTNYASLRAPDALAGNVVWKLPIADGTTGQVLETDGSGQLAWATVSSGSGGWTRTSGQVTPSTAADAVRVGAVGTAGTPIISYTGDTNTGFYFGSDQINVALGGSKGADFTAGASNSTWLSIFSRAVGADVNIGAFDSGSTAVPLKIRATQVLVNADGSNGGGSASAPAYGFTGYTGLGMYFAVGEIDFAVAGKRTSKMTANRHTIYNDSTGSVVNYLQSSDSGTTWIGLHLEATQILVNPGSNGAGSASVPLYSYSGAPTTGMYFGANEVNFACGGNLECTVNSNGVNLPSGNYYSVNGTQVVGARGATISDPAGGGTVDSEARTAINAIIDRLQAHGLIS